MQDIISILKNALQQAEAGLEVAVGRLAKDGTERGEFQPSEVLALAIVREALATPATCLHQIQEPAAAVQAAWHAGQDEGRAQAARPVVVPDDMPSTEANTKYGESYGVDWVYEGKTAAPAAVAWSMPAEPTEQMIEVLMAGEDRLRARHGDDLPKQRAKDRYRALLSLAATPAAAPVVLPEPFALYDGKKWYANEEAAICSCADMEKLQKVYLESQLRALLATATGLPAQAATEGERAAWFALAMNAAAYIEDAAACLRDGDAKSAATGAAKHVREKCNALWDSAPQTQADARDAEYRKVERRIVMTPTSNPKPAEVHMTWNFGEERPTILISGWYINGNGTDLPGNPDAAIHAACNLLLDELERVKKCHNAAIAAAKGGQQS